MTKETIVQEEWESGSRQIDVEVNTLGNIIIDIVEEGDTEGGGPWGHHESVLLSEDEGERLYEFLKGMYG